MCIVRFLDNIERSNAATLINYTQYCALPPPFLFLSRFRGGAERENLASIERLNVRKWDRGIPGLLQRRPRQRRQVKTESSDLAISYV